MCRVPLSAANAGDSYRPRYMLAANSSLQVTLSLRILLLAVVCIAPQLMLAQDGSVTGSAGDGESGRNARSSADAAIPSGAVRLLNGSSIDGEAWTYVSAKRDANPAATWRMTSVAGEPVLECSGQPFGLIRSSVEYEDFQLGLEWRFPEGNDGNSGVLLYTSGEPKVWPQAVQVQLHQPELGAILPVSGARVAIESKRVDVKSKPAGEWNTCAISSDGGVVSVEINGVAVGVVTGCEPHSGCLGLQSEGSPVQFRRIWVLPAEKKASSATIDETAVMPDKKSPSETINDAVDLRESIPVGYRWPGSGLHSVLAMEASGSIVVPVACDVRRGSRTGRVLSRRNRRN